MTITKKQQNNKQIPIELIYEISRSINGYGNLLIKKQINDTSKQQKYFVSKIKCSENVLISSRIIYLFSGNTLKEILVQYFLFL